MGHLLIRRPDWPERLASTLDRHRAAPFAWGTHDCATLWIECVRALTDRDPASGLPPWFSRVSAMRALRASGAASVADFIARHFVEIAPAAAGRGDLMLVDSADPLQGPAIVTGAEIQSRNEAEWVVASRAVGRRAFRVGDA